MELRPPHYGKIVAFDLETTVRGSVSFPANPYDDVNRVVASGHIPIDDGVDQPVINYLNMFTVNLQWVTTFTGLVGHNLMFDLAYVLRNCEDQSEVRRWLVSDAFIWDTSIAEYILTSQEAKFISLDEVSEKYGGTLKDDKIKKYWAEGLQTENIPPTELLEYLKGDVLNTRLVFNKQYQEAIETGKIDLIIAMCRAMVAFTIMQERGIEVDSDKLDHSMGLLKGNMELVEADINSTLRKTKAGVLATLHNIPLNFNSNKDLSVVLFGGELTYIEKQDVYPENGDKGRKKTLKHVRTVKVPPSFNGDVYSRPTSKGGIYSVDAEVLDKLNADVVPFYPSHESSLIGHILKFRKQKKYASYLQGLFDNMARNSDNKVHASYNLTATDTGRLSSSDPNMQNAPTDDESPVKKCFTSRFEGGAIIEADYKQLEVVALAYTSGCEALISDINNGVDIHTGLGWELYGEDYVMSKDERRTIKTINFGLIYGGSANTLAAQAGVERIFAKRAIEAFYKRYPGVRAWHDSLIEHAEKHYQVTDARTKKGNQVRTVYVETPTKRTYKYSTEDNDYYDPAKPWTDIVRWPITKMKNYPVQGLATGDIVPIMVAVMTRTLEEDTLLRNRCFIVNQVHDSLVFDVHPDIVTYAKRVIKNTLERAPQIISEMFNIEFELPLRVSVSVGPSWGDVKEEEEIV